MRIVTWNCRQGFDSKAEALLSLKPDIAIVPESLRFPEIAGGNLLASAIPHLWTGSIPAKGLGLFTPAADRFDEIKPENDSPGAHGIAARSCHGERETVVLGIWTIPLRGGRHPYIDAANGIIERYANVLAFGNAIVAGDFNASGGTNPVEMPAFAEMMNDRFGLVSAYHAFNGLKIGEEPSGTLWWRGKEADSFHCDFVFVPESWNILNVEIGSHETWGSENSAARSDHAPVIVDLAR